ncbi:MAG: TadE/TadG family type IV pilus assembly protein [Pseudohongiellaceae bacterium]
MIEFTFTLAIFLVVVLAIVEFSILMMNTSRNSEITRELARIAIVENPVCEIFDPDASCALSCPGGAPITLTLADAGLDCGATPDMSGCRMLNAAQNFNGDIEPGQITLTYACSTAGATNRPDPVPLITVALSGLTHSLTFPGLFGLEAIINISEFETTRTGEDLFTERF